MQHLFFTHHYCREVIPQPDGNAIASHVFFGSAQKTVAAVLMLNTAGTFLFIFSIHYSDTCTLTKCVH